MALRNLAAEYFSHLNPIAARIYADLQETKGAYEDLWTTLSLEEQDQILTESIIKPEISIKYSSPETKTSEEYAAKIVVDDHCSYRDEHSGPFSFRTRSQRNLTVFRGEPKQEPMIKICEEPVKVRPKPLLRPLTKPKPTNIPLFAQNLELEDISCLTKDEDGSSSNASTLPKTGLDFLDNW